MIQEDKLEQERRWEKLKRDAQTAGDILMDPRYAIFREALDVRAELADAALQSLLLRRSKDAAVDVELEAKFLMFKREFFRDFGRHPERVLGAYENACAERSIMEKQGRNEGNEP